VVHVCNFSTGEAEAERPWVQGQPGLHNEILSGKKKRKKKEREGRRGRQRILRIEKMKRFV
jgi:hypothetical protein